VNELARRLERDYKNVHEDVKRLAELGLIERRKDALVSVVLFSSVSTSGCGT